ncbi:MAG: acetyl-CoA carboxylase biotin carboxylase subunit [Ignavibacteria bacterium CG22_combo_CG10-13_8_21_14_all_37_15]|nr:acetyl-CoA carboxylase biotin carboxylase subunit [Ignavibacteria bacterium]OIO23477.1 MAG: acetyl-CoA carboxylase biotin carboxylase subunit [Ignavibacteria bacterium CG1_02_37_35]PIP79593.1 MAG: acetyl-CoA carboxylase biotin carboxylase subunit [Ignavibacteria bacterium CG22_combo_CG10-13_8_21_14_all_37_15]PIX93324.1 MAG: acetyl-CoA carboxylase biotin carboxylase subunit [Ignavibacteria bacterium CG_4_10_14_3_um_filter_37_18]PJC58600.1 MAG: acetyl-CoA carboxylase biotin carboxylase subunit
MFKKILIANRGEIALRIIRTCKELGIKTVAVYSEADKNSLHVTFADEAVCIGPALSKDSYLKIPVIISAAQITGAEAIHPGYGFLAENASFSEICSESGIKFIGPSPEMIHLMGNKANAKETMRKNGIPVIPGSDGVVANVIDGKAIAQEIGFPVIVKASAGGGGKGMRIVQEESEFENAFQTASSEAIVSFGNGEVYIEKYLENPRHIEFQIMGDQFGNVYHYGERDCSVQRRHQKLIEESPSPIMDAELRKKMGDASVLGARSVNYEGAGTIECLVDKHKNFYFMEMNTRIQVEHTVTEVINGVDLIRQQILVAGGEKIETMPKDPVGHAMEFRINAEDPEKGFRPNPGKIESLHFPGGFGIRVDSHVYQSYVIPPYYDSLLAKLIVWGKNRKTVIMRARRALEEFTVEGIKTTIPFHLEVLENEQFVSGNFDTSFLDNFLKEKNNN